MCLCQRRVKGPQGKSITCLSTEWGVWLFAKGEFDAHALFRNSGKTWDKSESVLGSCPGLKSQRPAPQNFPAWWTSPFCSVSKRASNPHFGWLGWWVGVAWCCLFVWLVGFDWGWLGFGWGLVGWLVGCSAGPLQTLQFKRSRERAGEHSESHCGRELSLELVWMVA